jgi:dipeptide/tripeptide permease
LFLFFVFVSNEKKRNFLGIFFVFITLKKQKNKKTKKTKMSENQHKTKKQKVDTLDVITTIQQAILLNMTSIRKAQIEHKKNTIAHNKITIAQLKTCKQLCKVVVQERKDETSICMYNKIIEEIESLIEDLETKI